MYLWFSQQGRAAACYGCWVDLYGCLLLQRCFYAWGFEPQPDLLPELFFCGRRWLHDSSWVLPLKACKPREAGGFNNQDAGTAGAVGT